MKEIRERIEPIYRNRLHPHYTDHSIVHVDRVAELAENLVAPLSRNRKLNDDEATVLYGGCYFHDIGMHNEKAGEQGRLKARLKQQGRTWERVRPEERLNIIRESHHEISADMVQKSSGSGRSPTRLRVSRQLSGNTLSERWASDPAWEATASLLLGANHRDADQIIEEVFAHPAWSQNDVARMQFHKVISSLAETATLLGCRRLLDAEIPHVATDAPGCDFKNALSIVRNVATRFPDLKSEIKGRLLDGKDRIPHLLLAMAPEFDASFAYKNPDGLATVASEHLRLQVERISDPETWTRGLGEVMVWQHNDPSGRVAVKIGSSAQELESVVAYRANISRPALAGLIDTIVKTICDPQNANTNRQMLFHFLGRLADSFSEETARLVLEIAVQYAVDHRAADHPLYGQDEVHSPLQSNRMNSGWPQDVRGEALIALAETTRRLPTIELARAKECIRRAMLDAHPTTRQMAYFAVGKLGDSASDLLPMVASGTRDADQDAAMMALYVVGLLATDAIDPRRRPRS